MKTSGRIFAFHLLNDRSGSPNVLSQLLSAWVSDGREVCLYTSQHTDGFLSSIPGVHYYIGRYWFKANPWLRLLFYTGNQIALFFAMMFVLKRSDTIYINTVLPFAAALIGKLKGCRILYHVHESTVSPAPLKWFLFQVIAWTADEIIYVSNYVKEHHVATKAKCHVVYNAIDENFLREVKAINRSQTPSKVLMICSLKAYKGIDAFVQLAIDHPQFNFRLVLNAAQADVDAYFKDSLLSPNLVLYPKQKDVHPFYQWADCIVNLSRPDGWIETFGLTIIEGMAYGLPAIVPPVGGILEVVEDGLTGFAVDSRDREQLNEKISLLLNSALYHKASEAALHRLELFREEIFLASISRIV